MKVLNYIKSEYSDFSKFERVFFLFVILLTSLIAFFIKDNIFSFISAVCGISYTILSGKGKVYSYYIGITGTFCYSYIAYKNGFFGNFFLYGFYFLPMQIIGIFKWKENLKKEKNEIIKTKLNLNEKLTYSFIFALLFIIFSYSLKHLNGSMPYFDRKKML